MNIKPLSMKKLNLLVISLMLILLSCENQEIDTSENSIVNDDKMEICMFDFMNSNNFTSKHNSIIIDWPRWKTGQIIKIKFLDGTSSQQELVKKIASEWIQYANLTFEYVPIDQYADIRIGFKIGTGGQWSVLGRNSTSYSTNYQNNPSMRLGEGISLSNEKGSTKIILHEFGHALGLEHETKNPASNIKWKFPGVYNFYINIMSDASKEDVDKHVINKSNNTNYSEYDPLSIMHYSIPAYITTDKIAVYQTNTLSTIDKESINKWYPFPVRSIINSGERIDFIPWVQSIKSPNEKYQLNFFHAGSLCIFDLSNNTIIWQVGDTRYSRQSCQLEANGNLRLIGQWSPKIGASRQTIWASNTSEYPGAELHLQNSGNLELIYNGAVKWSSKLGKL